jgi:exodeoxyribonuclease III
MKIVTYNINGIRAAITKGLIPWLQSVDADIVCFQEIKADLSVIPVELFEEIGYAYHYWFPAQKKGYSGVAVISKHAVDHVEIGMGLKKYDDEGRTLRIDIGEFSFMSVYMPSGSSGEDRQIFKYEWLDDFYNYIQKLMLQKKKLIISGDYNICHKAIDIHNPKSNANTSGFLPEERAWFDQFIALGFTDTFRHFNPEPHHYTWWSYRAGARGKNLGWRIDYHLATEAAAAHLKRCVILSEAMHSDHCPVLLEISMKG